MANIIHELEIWGDFACWTNPAGGKVERFSYPCCTPSGARGIFDAIYCKPHNHRTNEINSAEFRWAITRIEILDRAPSYIALRRNEVGDVASTRNVDQWIDGKQPEPMMADDSAVRQQRQTMALRDVRFRIAGQIIPWPGHARNQKAFDEQFIRRASQGKCVMQPYLGCREFVAFFKHLPAGEPRRPAVDWSADLGMMVFDVFDLSSPGRNSSRPFVSLFHAKVEHGVLNVPGWHEDDRVLKPARGVPLMLSELTNYARGKGLDTEAGFRSKDIRWLMLFNADGVFIDVAPYGVEKSGRNVSKCPHIQFSGDTPMRQFLADTAQYYALLGGSVDDPKLRRKHAYAVDLLAKAGVEVPGLGVIATSMMRAETIDSLRAALVHAKAKPADNVTPALIEEGGDRRIFLEETSWHSWWRSYLPTLFVNEDISSVARQSTSRCLISGVLCEPSLTHPKVRGLGDVGGKVETALVSFNQDSFCSYGLEQSANAAVSSDAANIYVGALNHLIEHTGQRLGNVKVIHWFAGRDDRPIEVSPEQDPIRHIESLNDTWGEPAKGAGTNPKKVKKRDIDAEKRAAEMAAQASARDFLRSVKSGERSEMADYRYYAITLSGSSARVMVRDYVVGRFDQLCESVDAWFNDLEIVGRDGGGPAPDPKFGAVLGAMVREMKDVSAPVAAKLWRCAVLREPIPEPFAAQALHRAALDFIKAETPKHARMGLLRAYLFRKGDTAMKPYLNDDHPDPAYHCGRLLAVLDDIQYAAMGDVGAGIVQRYYAAASATPALVLGRLVRLANTGHLPKVDYDRRQRLEHRLASVWGRLEYDPPTTLSLAQQTLFAMGYYQQKSKPLTHTRKKLCRNQLTIAMSSYSCSTAKTAIRTEIPTREMHRESTRKQCAAWFRMWLLSDVFAIMSKWREAIRCQMPYSLSMLRI